MIWLSWRQHRSEALSAAALLALVGLALLFYGLRIRGVYGADGMAGCLHSDSDGCIATTNDFLARFATVADNLVPFLSLVFGLIGAVVGGPLLAREYEQGTWRLAWTQTVPRTRWLLTKLGLVITTLVAFTVAMSAIVAWYRAPLDAVEGRFTHGAFDFEGLSLTGYTLLSFALGVLTGLLIRRVVSAIVVAYAGFLVVRLPVEFWLRPNYQTPVTTFIQPQTTSNPVPHIDWQLGSGWADATGHHLSTVQKRQLRMGIPDSASGSTNYLQAHHIQFWQTYQPDGRFWTFQLIEFGIFAGLAAVVLAVAIWWLHHREI